MPLCDHFHEPTKSRLPYSALHLGWATYLATRLVKHWLLRPYIAVEHSNLGKVESDVATYDSGDPHAVRAEPGAVPARPE